MVDLNCTQVARVKLPSSRNYCAIEKVDTRRRIRVTLWNVKGSRLFCSIFVGQPLLVSGLEQSGCMSVAAANASSKLLGKDDIG